MRSSETPSSMKASFLKCHECIWGDSSAANLQESYFILRGFSLFLPWCIFKTCQKSSLGATLVCGFCGHHRRAVSLAGSEGRSTQSPHWSVWVLIVVSEALPGMNGPSWVLQSRGVCPQTYVISILHSGMKWVIFVQGLLLPVHHVFPGSYWLTIPLTESPRSLTI